MYDKELAEFCKENIERFMNLSELQKALQYETISAEFTERELKGLIYALDTLYLKLKEQEHE